MAFVALYADYGDPVLNVLAIVSAILRVIGNGFKLLKNIGGMLMKKSNIICRMLNKGVETLLAVGNLGALNLAASNGGRVGSLQTPVFT